MATFKAEVYKHQKKLDGTYNIKIRVFHNGEKKYLATAWYVEKKDLTQKLKIKNQKYKDLTDDLIHKFRNKCDILGERLKTMNVQELVDYITAEDKESFDLDIVAYTRKYIAHLESTGHKGNASAYRVAINNLIKFVGRDSISIRAITVRFLKDWIDWMGMQPLRGGKVRTGRAQSLYLSEMRAMYNRAKREYNDEDAGIIRIPYSPFKKVEIPKIPLSRKRALSVDQIRQLSELPYSHIFQPGTNRYNFAKDIFLLSFCLIGMNAVDLYYCSDYKNGRITYQRTKTKNRRADRAEISIKLEPEIMPIFEKYKDPTGERVFKFYHIYSCVNTMNQTLNYGLKIIGKHIGVEGLTFYAARHSWATIAANEAEIDKYTIHTALNHVDENMKVTDIYIKKSWKPIDRANRKVLDLLKLDLTNVDENINNR